MHPWTQPGNFSERPRTSLKCEFLRELLCVWSIRSSDDANGDVGITLPLATALSKTSFYLENSSPLLFLC